MVKGWTKKLPTRSGVYWMRYYFDTPDTVRVLAHEGKFRAVDLIGSNTPHRARDFPASVEWYGPIKPPKE